MLKKTLLISALLIGAAFAANAEERVGGQMFEKADTNSDGFISKDEFLASAEKRFEKIDGNKDGKLTQEEFKTHHQEVKEKIQEKREKIQKRKAEKTEQKSETAK